MKTFGIVGIIVLGALLVIIGPIITIWCLDTLFPSLAIPYTLDTWLATALLGSAVFARGKK